MPTDDITSLVTQILSRPGWTQQRLAEELDVSQPTVHRWLRGACPMGWHWDVIRSLHFRLFGAATDVSDEHADDLVVRVTISTTAGEQLACLEQTIQRFK